MPFPALPRHIARRSAAAVALAATALGGCASVRPQHAAGDIAATLDGRTAARTVWRTDAHADARADRALDSLFAAPLTADAAVQATLLASRRLQAAYEDIGVAQADLVQAGLLANPLLGAGLRFPLDAAGAPDAHVSVAASVLSVFTRPARRSLARSTYEAARLRVAAAVLSAEADTRAAFYGAQTDRARADLARTVAANAQAAHRAAVLLREAGNVPALDVLASQAQFEQARLDLVAADAQAAESRERLARTMGVFGARATAPLAGTLPPVPDAAAAERPMDGATGQRDGHEMNGHQMDGRSMGSQATPVAARPAAPDAFDALARDAVAFETRAVASSLALAAARADIAAAARRLGIADATALVPDLEIGAELERSDGDLELGPDVEIRLPLFDAGQARRARARSDLRRARARYYALGVDVRSAARVLARRLDATRALALHAQRVVLPLRADLTRQTLLQYNAMQTGVFGLLDAQRLELDASRRYLDRLADYWRARTDAALLAAGGMPDLGASSVRDGGASADDISDTPAADH